MHNLCGLPLEKECVYTEATFGRSSGSVGFSKLGFWSFPLERRKKKFQNFRQQNERKSRFKKRIASSFSGVFSNRRQDTFGSTFGFIRKWHEACLRARESPQHIGREAALVQEWQILWNCGTIVWLCIRSGDGSVSQHGLIAVMIAYCLDIDRVCLETYRRITTAKRMVRGSARMVGPTHSRNSII